MTKSIRWRVALGFLLAPIAGFAATGLVFLIAHALHHGFAEFGRRTPLDFADLQLAYAFCLLVGLPMYFIFKAQGLVKFWHSLLTGLALGFLLSVTVSLIAADKFSAIDVQSMLLCSFLGGVTTSVFWLVAIRPEKLVIQARPG
jgi:hypothetical protein